MDILLFTPWFPEFIENHNSVSAGAHKVGKIVFGSTCKLIFPIFEERQKVNERYSNTFVLLHVRNYN